LETGPAKAVAEPNDWQTVQSSQPTDWETVPAPGKSTAQGEQPGFISNLAHAFGADPGSLQARQADLAAHPIRSTVEALGGPAVMAGEGLISGGKRIGGELKKAFQAGEEGNAPGVASHAISAIPFVGPALDKMSDESPPTQPGESYAGKVWADATPGNIGTAMGTAAQLAPAVLGGADEIAPDRPLVGEIPTRAKAGKVFESVMKDAQGQPVNMTRSMVPLERAQQLSARGHGTVSAADNLYKRVNTVNPLDYREARDWASGLSRLSANDTMNASPSLRAQVGKLSHAFNDDVGDAATAAGRGEDYAKAMRDYRRASQFNDAAKTAAKWAIPAAAGGGALSYGLKKVMQ
jgi:hypothetical protein